MIQRFSTILFIFIFLFSCNENSNSYFTSDLNTHDNSSIDTTRKSEFSILKCEQKINESYFRVPEKIFGGICDTFGAEQNYQPNWIDWNICQWTKIGDGIITGTVVDISMSYSFLFSEHGTEISDSDCKDPYKQGTLKITIIADNFIEANSQRETSCSDYVDIYISPNEYMKWSYFPNPYDREFNSWIGGSEMKQGMKIGFILKKYGENFAAIHTFSVLENGLIEFMKYSSGLDCESMENPHPEGFINVTDLLNINDVEEDTCEINDDMLFYKRSLIDIDYIGGKCVTEIPQLGE